MLARVARLEQADAPFQRVFGSVEEFQGRVQAGIADGVYDPRDIAAVSAAVRRWMGQGAADHVLSCA